jgi:Tol biopolymer transport system component
MRIFNQSLQVDHYRIMIEGIPIDWVKNLPDHPVRCMPGEEQVVSLAVQPPRVSESWAGRYPIYVLVASQADSGQVVRSSAAITVTPFHQFSGQIHPERIRSGRPCRLRIANQGNTPEIFQVAWSDPADELVFEPPEARISVEAGETAEMAFSGRLRQTRWMGGEKPHRFHMTVSLENSQPRTLQGEILSRGLLPGWVIPLLFSLCGMFAVVAGGYYGLFYLPNTHATQTAAAVSIMNSDPDQDGLSNADEEREGTDPNKADTDRDGLIDGVEVDIHGTDPKDRDSDEDNLFDGVEVNEIKCANPNVPDTDRDGVVDNLDPNPCELPTATLIPTRFGTPSPLPVATQSDMPSTTWTSQPPTLTPYKLPTLSVPPSDTLPPPPPTATVTQPGLIIFESNRGGDSELYVFNLEDENDLRLTNSPGTDSQPAWSPDGERIAFTSARDGNNEIYVMDNDGANLTNLTQNEADDQQPAWSADGESIVFTSNRDGNNDIFIMVIDGSDPQNITENPANDYAPAWQSAGDQIVFTTDRDGNNEIYSINPDGTHQVNLTQHFANDVFPAVSWNGGQVLFVSDRDGNNEIYRMDADGDNPVNLTGNPANDTFPSWSPDEQWIAFTSDREGHLDIFVMRANGNDAANLTRSPAQDRFTTWR